MSIVRKKIIGQRTEQVRPEKLVRTLSLKEFAEKRNKILIIRSVGGLGDIFMHRMMFEDFKKTMPDAELHFCCPKYYHDALIDHPYIDKLIDSNNFDRKDYLISYNTTTACGRTEMRYAPMSGPHRSDIWAEHCGLKLANHNMHISLTEDEKKIGRSLIEENRDIKGKTVAICPISAMANKNLLDDQLLGLISGCRDRGLAPFCLHNTPINLCYKNNIPLIVETKIRNWMAVLNQADYVVSVDTSAFHCAGGMGKPLVGIFTFADGLVYGKYFDFFLVQKHRQNDPCWTCGPCYNWGNCSKSNKNLKPCLTEITSEMIMERVDNMLQKWPNGNYYE
jgi:ADP-heptose:LPS heptosyltransferase